MRSIAGAALVGLGTFIFYGNLDDAATQLSHLLGTTARETLGMLPAVILAASRVLQSYAADHQRFLQGFLQHTLVSSWPLLLVMAGAALSRDSVTDNVNTLPKKDCGLVHLTARRSTLK